MSKRWYGTSGAAKPAVGDIDGATDGAAKPAGTMGSPTRIAAAPADPLEGRVTGPIATKKEQERAMSELA